LQSLIDAGIRGHSMLMKPVFQSGLLHTLAAEVCISVCLVAVAAALVLLFAPLAAGGGVAVSWRWGPLHWDIYHSAWWPPPCLVISSCV